MSKCTNRMTTFKKNRPKTSRCSRFPAFQLQEQQKVLAVPPRLLLEIEVLSTSPAGYTSGRWKWNPLNQLWTKHKPTAKGKPKLSMYKYMYMKSFKPAQKKKGLCFPTSKSMQRNESPAFTVRQKAASRRFTGFPQSPHRHPSEFSDETLRFRYIPGKITWQAGKIPIFNRKFIFQVVDFPIAMLVFGKVVWIFGQSSGLTTAIGEQPTHELTVLDLAISIGISLQECQPNGSCPNEVWPYGLNLD